MSPPFYSCCIQSCAEGISYEEDMLAVAPAAATEEGIAGKPICDQCWDDLCGDSEILHSELEPWVSDETRVKNALMEMVLLVSDMSRFVGSMALQDYARFNEAPIVARKLLGISK